jgi:hypothetical protein
MIKANLSQIQLTKAFINLSTTVSISVITLLLLLSLPVFFGLANKVYSIGSFLFFLPRSAIAQLQLQAQHTLNNIKLLKEEES